MLPKGNCNILIYSIAVLAVLRVLYADSTPNSIPKDTVTPPPVKTVEETDLCTKCICHEAEARLDCSNKNISTWLTQEELDALLYDNHFKFEIISFEGNQLKEIPEFPDLINVKELNFHNNKIEKIADGAFTKLTSLKKLDLSYNSLTTKALDQDVFSGKFSPTQYEPMKTLTHLNLAGNQLHSFHPDLFSHFPRIEVLNLSSNSFQHIDDTSKTAISGLGYIMEIDLSNMGLQDLPAFLFNYHRNDLKILVLNGNKFVNIPFEAIGKALNLEELYLDGNEFISFEYKNKFPVLPNLKTLSVSNCPYLQFIGPGTFSGLKSLENVKIANNPKLDTIHPSSFFYFMNNSTNVTYPPVKTLIMKNNKLEELPETLLKWSTIKKLDLTHNPWSCTCKNKFLLLSIIQQIRLQDPEYVEALVCSKPDKLKGVQIKQLNTGSGRTLNCETTGNNYTVLTGMLIGILMSIPIAFLFFIIYRRGCFGFVNSGGPGAFSKAFYKRTRDEEFM